jgi:hypothetical protein
MDWWILVYVLVIPVGLGLSYLLDRGKVNALKKIADKYHGTVTSGWYFRTTELTIPYRGLTLHIVPYIHTARGSYRDPDIQATMKLDAPHLPELSLSRYSLVLLKKKKNSPDPIPTGDQEFDRLFVVHGSDRVMVEKVFTDGVREKLENTKSGLSFSMKPDNFVMSGSCGDLDSQAYEAFTDAVLVVLDQAWA